MHKESMGVMTRAATSFRLRVAKKVRHAMFWLGAVSLSLLWWIAVGRIIVALTDW